jgi:hypothetical protein
MEKEGIVVLEFDWTEKGNKSCELTDGVETV